MTNNADIVYLCAPITGNPEDAERRAYIARELHKASFRVLDPLRGKDAAQIGDHGLRYGGHLCPVEYAMRDRADVRQAGIVLADITLIDPERPPFGTPWEMGWADAWNKRLVVCASLRGYRDHLFTRAFAESHEHIDEAIAAVVAGR